MRARTVRQSGTSWLWVAGVWLAIALVSATQTVIGLRAEGIQRPLTVFFVVNALSWLPWALATPLVLRLGLRFPPNGSAGIAGWSTHVAAFLAAGFAHATWNTALQWYVHPWGPANHPRPFAMDVVGRFLNALVLGLIVYAAVLTIGYTVESRRRLAMREMEAERLNAQLSHAQLGALRRQLEPHFLFNTLNAISGLVRDQRNDAAVEMIAGLSDLLRRVLADAGRQEVPLGEELEFLNRYLEIQQMRFTSRLRVEVDVPQDLYTAQVPSLILQPMVENAIQHGIGKLVEGGAIRIAAAHADSTLVLSVHNDGPALPLNWDAASAGIGISNTRARMRGLYGADCGLELRNHPSSGVEAVLTVPYRTAAS